MDFFCKFSHRCAAVPIQSNSLFSNQGMICGHQRYIRPETDIISYKNSRVIYHHKVEIGKEILSDIRMAPIVKLYRPLEITCSSHFADNPAQNRNSFRIVFIHGIVTATCLMSLMLDILQFRLSRIKHFSCKNLLFLVHNFPL